MTTLMTTSMTTSITRGLGGALVALALGGLLPASALAADFVVNSSADPGDGVCDATNCTLREAINAANDNDESDTITFNLAADDRVILLDEPPPGVLTALTIANDAAAPDLTIDGDLDGDGVPDITVDAQPGSRVFSIASGANATLEGLEITGGFVADDGGGIFNDGGTLAVINSTIRGNFAIVGGAIHNDGGGTLTVTNSTIRGNTSNFGPGGIGNEGTLTVANSTISGNSGGDGGGIGNRGTLTLANSTISGNDGEGGGIDNRGTLTLANSTISGNFGRTAGGVLNLDTLEIKSTIIAGNTADDGADCFNAGTLTSLGFNLDGGTSCGFTATGDQQNVAVAAVLVTDANGDPLLADNGGPTRTIALLDTDTNPAIDAIPAADCTFPDDVPELGDQGVPVLFDQRGINRPQPLLGGDCDIGAFELVQAASVTIADVIELFDDAVAGGALTGAGPGNSAAGRLNALRNMLLTAGELLEQGDVDGACAQLQDAADRTDGAFPPPDFVRGPAAADLFDAITEVQDELGCLA